MSKKNQHWIPAERAAGNRAATKPGLSACPIAATAAQPDRAQGRSDDVLQFFSELAGGPAEGEMTTGLAGDDSPVRQDRGNADSSVRLAASPSVSPPAVLRQHQRTSPGAGKAKKKKAPLTDEEVAVELEMKKLKSVQSARDCRRRKKAFIQSLQLKVKECEEREQTTQGTIAALEHELKTLRGTSSMAATPELKIIETLLTESRFVTVL
jgi:hypothetical protein